MTRVRHKRTLSCVSAFKQIARAAFRDVQRAHLMALGGAPEGIHRMRIGFTRLVAARKFFAAMVTDATWPLLKREIRWAHRILGEARDNDVALAFADEIAGRHIRAIDRRVRFSHTRVARALRSTRFRALLIALRAWIDHGPWTARSHVANAGFCEISLDAFVVRRLAKWSRRLARYAHPMKVRREHRARITAKRYRYMVDALDEVGIDISRSQWRKAKAARQLQDALGDLRDLRRVRHEIGMRGKSALKARKHRLLRQSKAALRKFS